MDQLVFKFWQAVVVNIIQNPEAKQGEPEIEGSKHKSVSLKRFIFF